MVSGPKSSKYFTILSLEPREAVDRVDAFSSTMTGTSEFSGLALPVSSPPLVNALRWVDVMETAFPYPLLLVEAEQDGTTL